MQHYRLQNNSFLIAMGCPPEVKCVPGPATYSAPHLQLWLNNLNDSHAEFCLSDQGFQLYLGEFGGLQRSLQDPTASHQGALLTYSAPAAKLVIKGDRLGTMLLYYRQHPNGGWLVSNRIENLALDGAEPDWSSVQQYLHTGFTVGSSTLFKDIHQTLPNQEIHITAESKPAVSFAQLPLHQPENPAGEAEVMERLSARLLEVLAARKSAVLMMSAGWDSRTLLAPGSRYLSGAYTHGDLSSREIGIARKLSGQTRLDHLFTDVTSIALTADAIDEMMAELGYAIFPVWYFASHIIKRWKSAPIMSGVLGELLGGHYGLMSFGSRWQKLAFSISIINDDAIPKHHIERAIENYCTPPQSHWFVSASGQAILDSIRIHTKQRIHEEIQANYRQSGSWQRALEDFNMAHRARQYILKQAQTSINSIGYYAPFADPLLVDLTRQLGFDERVHNKTNRRLLKKLNPTLLNSPTAATLIAARYPIVLQELSRGIRILVENLSTTLGKEKPRPGWFNYSHLYDSSLLHDLTDSLRHDFWDRSRMHGFLDKQREMGIDVGFTLDMLCKLKYVDHILTLPSHSALPAAAQTA